MPRNTPVKDGSAFKPLTPAQKAASSRGSRPQPTDITATIQSTTVNSRTGARTVGPVRNMPLRSVTPEQYDNAGKSPAKKTPGKQGQVIWGPGGGIKQA
jgi:hypothetical protein